MNQRKLSRRIAILLPSLRGGGAERVGVTLANEFVLQGQLVDLVLVVKEGPYLKDVHPSVRIVDLRAGRVLRSFRRLVSYLRAERPIALFSTFHHSNVIALVARRVARVPTRIVVGAANMLGLRTRSSTDLAGRLLGRFAPKIYLGADAVVAVSHGVAADLFELEPRLKRSTVVIYNPVVSHEFIARSRESPGHPWLDEPVPVLLAVGRLVPEKDYKTLLRAFARVRESQRVRLLVLGEGIERAELEALVRWLGIENDVSFPGFAENPFSFMARASLYVMSSRTEGLPNALIQAMALGIRIVSTDCPSGPREILQGGKYGKLVEVGNTGELAKAISESLALPALNIPEEALEPFRVDVVARKYLAVLVPES